MAYRDVKPRQMLWTKSGESVEVFAVSKNCIIVVYKGKIYKRSKNILGKKLFLERPANIVDSKMTFVNMKDKSQQTNPLNSQKPIGKTVKPHMESSVVETSQKNKDQHDVTKVCSNCMKYRSEKCFGSKSICFDFKYTGKISNEEREHWPEYGDASYMRMKRFSRNK